MCVGYFAVHKPANLWWYALPLVSGTLHVLVGAVMDDVNSRRLTLLAPEILLAIRGSCFRSQVDTVHTLDSGVRDVGSSLPGWGFGVSRRI